MKTLKTITIQRQKLLRNIGVFLSIPMFVIALFPLPTYAQTPQCDKDFYSLNDILFYDPCSSTCSGGVGGALTGPAPSSLTGDSKEHKVWNYFAARGLTPVAAAGAMGNIAHESNFSASVEEASGGGGLGIIQWTGDRRTKLEAAASAAGVSLVDEDSALLFQLNYLWDGEYGGMTWQEQVNAETTVEGNTAIASFNKNFSSQLKDPQTGNGSTMVFHALVERSNDVPTEADRYSGVGVLQGRIDKANEFLARFFETETSGSCVVSANGLTWDQAVALAKKVADNWNEIYCGTNAIKGGFYCGWNEGYCTAGAAWMAVMTAPEGVNTPGIPDGVNVAGRLISMNPDVYTSTNPDGSNLQPFSIWSFGDGNSKGEPGHTGTIVGVGEDGSIITFETNWAGNTNGATNTFLYNPGHKVAVFEYPSFEAFKNSRSPGYAYNETATPKDSSVAAQMATKITSFIGVGN